MILKLVPGAWGPEGGIGVGLGLGLGLGFGLEFEEDPSYFKLSPSYHYYHPWGTICSNTLKLSVPLK